MCSAERSLDTDTDFVDDSAVDGIEFARAVNERIRELTGGWVDGEYHFVCECSDEGCYRAVRMSGHDYDIMRTQTNCRVVVPGHQQQADEIISYDAERVIVNRSGESRKATAAAPPARAARGG